MNYVYLIYSERSDMYYIGQTNNLEERLTRHNQNRCRSTKNRGLWKLIGYKTCNNRSEAILLERKLKGLKNREVLKKYFT